MFPDSDHNAEAVQAQPCTMQDIYAEALQELRGSDDDAVKCLIKERLAEIKRLQTLLAKAQKELDDLMALPVDEVALIAGGSSADRGPRMLKGGF